ncbi:MAG: 1,2-phenylacetyl-CoA epoxidase subunit PaaC [Bacteroidia bacterium]|nr:phenylacetate-CoA oxygenase subunit PaaC [Bacteroidia bacterium]MDW8157766.1 1,2-phenylacetyl-CoA epoxidase subunit PaaC [Bacteroidia bacterium]
MQNLEALKNLLYRLADDFLIMGHRDSEWIGLGPILEEDIAFASMAQDKVGYSLSFYTLLHELGEADPDTIAFKREAIHFKCAQFVEMPIQDYAFSLIRHFFFDYAADTRIQALKNSSYDKLRDLANKISRELKYHCMHAKTMVTQIAKGNEDGNSRLQEAVNTAFPMALSLFEPTEFCEELAQAGICPTEASLQKEWLQRITPLLIEASLSLPQVPEPNPYYGGRKGYHTDYLDELIQEMTAVIRLEPEAVW